MWSLLARILLAAGLKARPPAPGRLGELVRLFRIAHPHATADAWEAFCVAAVGAAYWEGERRGCERARGADEAHLRARHDWAAAASRPALADSLAKMRPPNDPLAGASPEQVEQVRAAIRAGVRFELRVEPERREG